MKDKEVFLSFISSILLIISVIKSKRPFYRHFPKQPRFFCCTLNTVPIFISSTYVKYEVQAKDVLFKVLKIRYD